jgi:iron complex outermembrane receptor protein
MVYASWGQGIESDVVPNRARYTNAGQALPALKSRQVEMGYQARADAISTSAWRPSTSGAPRPATWAPATPKTAARASWTVGAPSRCRSRRRLAPAAWQLQAAPCGCTPNAKVSARRPERPAAHQRARTALQGSRRPTTPQVPLPGLAAGFVTHESDRACAALRPSGDDTGWTRLDLGCAGVTPWATTAVWRRRRQRRPTPRLEGVPLPVRPRLPVPHWPRAPGARPRKPRSETHRFQATIKADSPIAQSVERRTVNP